MLEKQLKRKRRHRRVRAKISGIAKLPRLCVFRSSKHIYCQLVDDEKGKVIITVSDLKIKPQQTAKDKSGSQADEKKKNSLQAKKAIAYQVGQLTAQEAKKKKIAKVVFDRGGYKYHGRVKALAEGARKEGLKF